MMTNPGITELDKCVDSRYTLVSMVAKRARMIGTQNHIAEENGTAPVTAKGEKPVTQAVGEIYDGTVGYVRSAAVALARQYEDEKMNAISQFEKEQIIHDAVQVEEESGVEDTIEE